MIGGANFERAKINERNAVLLRRESSSNPLPARTNKKIFLVECSFKVRGYERYVQDYARRDTGRSSSRRGTIVL